MEDETLATKPRVSTRGGEEGVALDPQLHVVVIKITQVFDLDVIS